VLLTVLPIVLLTVLPIVLPIVLLIVLLTVLPIVLLIVLLTVLPDSAVHNVKIPPESVQGRRSQELCKSTACLTLTASSPSSAAPSEASS
jgi:hypothetical protein